MSTPSQGTGFPDGVRGGKLRAPSVDQGAPGAPYGMIYPWIVTPEAGSPTNLRAAGAIAAAGSLVLTAGAGVTQSSTTYTGYTSFDFDVPRALTFTTAGPTVNAVDITTSGWGWNKEPMVETVSLAAGAAVTNGKKAFSAVHSCVASGATGGGTISIGTSDILGIPYKIVNSAFLFANWDGVPDYTVDPAGAIMSFGGTFTPADQSTPTATTGDVRGTYLPNPSVTPTGAIPLNVLLTLAEIDPIYHRGEDVTVENVYGKPNYSVGWV